MHKHWLYPGIRRCGGPGDSPRSESTSRARRATKEWYPPAWARLDERERDAMDVGLVCHQPMVAARSRSSSQRLIHVSPPQPPIEPSAWITRWQGTTGESGQRAIEPPAARAARG